MLLFGCANIPKEVKVVITRDASITPSYLKISREYNLLDSPYHLYKAIIVSSEGSPTLWADIIKKYELSWDKSIDFYDYIYEHIESDFFTTTSLRKIISQAKSLYYIYEKK